MSPERALILPEETIVTPKMSVPASPIAGTPTREAQSPMSILLAVAQSQVNKTGGNGDDDLTNLAWLHERDLLKGMNIVNPSPSNSLNSTPIKYTLTNNNNNNNNNSNNNNNNNLLSDQSPTSDYIDDSSASTADSSNSSLNSPIPTNNVHQINHQNVNNQRNKHPHNVLYDPLVHTNSKPPYSFSCLIFMAIEDSDQKALPVKEIYTWILDHFPYFRTAPMGWKNSVRHNLSLNKCFQKIEKAPNLGKGSLWTVDQQYRPNLLQALTRSPFHRCSTLDPSVYFNNKKPSNERTSNTTRLPNPQLFPYLASEMNRRIKSEPREDSLDEVDAAAVMLSLRNGLRHRQKRTTCQVITSSPSQDHTYSAADSYVDEAFESDEEDLKLSKSSICRRIDFEDEEERKIKEGAETLLNLAGISTRKRGNSSSLSYNVEKRGKKEVDDDDDDEDEDENVGRPQHFRPRLLRKKKDVKRISNNNSIIVQADDAWVKHRRELEMNQRR